MRGSRKFCQRGSNLDNFFDEGRENPSITISEPLVVRRQNAMNEDDVPMMAPH